MKTSIKISLLILLLIPLFVRAETKYIPIQDSVSKTVDQIEVKSLHFVDNTDKPANNFGLISELENTTDRDFTLKAKISFYTEEKVLLYSSIEYYDVIKNKESTLIFLLDRKLNSKYEIENIKFYSVEFELLNRVAKEKIPPINDPVCLENDYVIEDYALTLKVKEDSTYDAEERFRVDYLNDKRKFKRYVPTQKKLTNRDNSKVTENIKLLEFENDESLNKSYQIGKGTTFRIDDSKMEESNEHTLNYTYMVKSNSKTDFLDFAISTTEWGSCINNASFKIELPFDFDVSNIQFVNDEGKDRRQNISINKVNNTLIGNYNSYLKDDEVHIRLYLDENYFKDKFPTTIVLMFLIPLSLVATSFVLWLIFGRDKKMLVLKSDKIPVKTDVFEYALIKRGTIAERDIAIATIKLAQEEYIELKKTGKDRLTGATCYDITKLKDYKGKDRAEKYLLEGLFQPENVALSTLKKVPSNKRISKLAKKNISINTKVLKTKLFTVAQNIKKTALEDKHDKLYEKGATKLSKIANIFNYIILFTIVSLPTLKFGKIEDLLIMLSLVCISFFSIKEGFKKENSLTTKIVSSIIILLAIMISRTTTLWETLLFEKRYIWGIVLGLYAIGLNELFKKIMLKKTAYGTKLLEQLKSLKMFLSTADKKELGLKLKEDDKYFDDIIPYTFILDSEATIFKVASREKIAVPKWLKNATMNDLKRLASDLEWMFKEE